MSVLLCLKCWLVCQVISEKENHIANEELVLMLFAKAERVH